MKTLLKLMIVSCVTACIQLSLVWSCTGILLKTKDGHPIYARTMELNYSLDSQILYIPKNYNFTAMAPSGIREGLQWTSKYMAMGVNARGALTFVDGVNEVGLAGGIFYFPDFAKYKEVSCSDYSKSIPAWELLTWILTSCGTVEEVREGLKSIIVSNEGLLHGQRALPLHFIIHDSGGNSLVIEYSHDGMLFLHDNPLGVITNAPTFDWHLINLRNYINLSPLDVLPQSSSGLPLSQLGNGSGMLGLPGDFTPPSRFVRAVAFTQATLPADTELEAVHQAFHILNHFDIPKGVVINAAGMVAYTQWTTAIDLINLTLYFHTDQNPQLHKIELRDIYNLGADSMIMLPMHYPNTVVDVATATH